MYYRKLVLPYSIIVKTIGKLMKEDVCCGFVETSEVWRINIPAGTTFYQVVETRLAGKYSNSCFDYEFNWSNNCLVSNLSEKHHNFAEVSSLTCFCCQLNCIRKQMQKIWAAILVYLYFNDRQDVHRFYDAVCIFYNKTYQGIDDKDALIMVVCDKNIPHRYACPVSAPKPIVAFLNQVFSLPCPEGRSPPLTEHTHTTKAFWLWAFASVVELKARDSFTVQAQTAVQQQLDSMWILNQS